MLRVEWRSAQRKWFASRDPEGPMATSLGLTGRLANRARACARTRARTRARVPDREQIRRLLRANVPICSRKEGPIMRLGSPNISVAKVSIMREPLPNCVGPGGDSWLKPFTK